ncbi:MAG: ATP-binding protein [Lachnospiraceae bacterium]|nr:ATP-binding protein [Lachnospiraceae bacterium]
MKYFFSNNCYWDSEKLQIIRNDETVDLPASHKKIIVTLLKNNGSFVSHQALYFAIYGDENPSGDWKASLSNKFTRNKASEKGLLIRVPEIEPYFEKSKSLDFGGYKITVPKENIVDKTTENVNIWEEYRDIWYSKKYWENQQRKAREAEPDWLAKKTKLYLQGEQCSWPLIFASSQYTPVKRDVVDELIDVVRSEIGAIVLTGPGGEGKTTILMQLCAELFYARKTVLYHDDTTKKFDFPDNMTEGIFLVDNPTNTAEFKGFLTRATKEGFTVIVASRSNEWANLRETLFDDTKRSIREIEIPKISNSESESFAQYIKKHIPWIKRNETELKKLFLKDSYGFLYASMLMAIYNADSLEKIAEKIIKRISEFENGKKTLKILAGIVFAERAETNIGIRTFRFLCRYFSIADRDVKFYLRKEVVLNGAVYQTRHEVISRLFYKYLFIDGDWWSCLNEEEREDVIIAVLNSYLEDVMKYEKDYRPTDPRTLEISRVFVQAFTTIDCEETKQYIIQRMLESCQQHGHAIIDRTYHRLGDNFVKNDIAIKCFERKLPLWEIYRHWLWYLSSESASFNMIIGYFETLCLEMEAPINIWNTWIDLYERELHDNATSISEIRKIYKLGLKTLANNAHWWISWASFEEKHGNIGDETVEYSARWLLREGCNFVQDNPHLWIKWADAEAKNENLGNIDTEYSARWIARKGCEKTKEAHIWLKRAELEERAGNIGDISNSDSVRGIFYLGCLEFPQSTFLWSKWAEFEARMGNIGDYETVNSAAWIFKEACINHGVVSDQAIWCKWVDFAILNNSKMRTECSNIWTPSRIFRCACVEHNVPTSLIWRMWAFFEEEKGNIGGYQVEYSSAWIFKESCVRDFVDSERAWVDWACFVERNKEKAFLLTDFPLDDILKTKCLLGTSNVFLWLSWAIIEETKGNIGDYSTEYSAAWLYRKSCSQKNPTGNALCLLRWIKFAQRYALYDTSGELINDNYVFDFARRTHETFRSQEQIDLTELEHLFSKKLYNDFGE